jgi:translation initiation factor 1A
MVKNTFGGNKHKGQARKFVVTNTKQVAKTRFAIEDGELYAQVVKYLGNGMCHVLCHDEKTRLCHIRGKFRGRGKRDNMITNGKWVLIGIRDYESEKAVGKLDNCDLLDVYSDQDKERLKNQIQTVNWSQFILNDRVNTNTNEGDTIDDGFDFTDEKEDEYKKIMEMDISSKKINLNLKIEKEKDDDDEDFVVVNHEDEINIDDI